MLEAAAIRPVGWPPTKAGTGPALDRYGVAARLGVSVAAVYALESRTRRGSPPVPFPAPDGRAVRPPQLQRGRGGHVVPYWFERKIEHYGKASGMLDAQSGKPMQRFRNQHASTRKPE